jgi:hypothetical protein
MDRSGTFRVLAGFLDHFTDQPVFRIVSEPLLTASSILPEHLEG